MSVACILVLAVVAATPTIPSQLSRTMLAQASQRPTWTRATIAARHGEPPRLALGYRATQLDLRWRAPDVERGEPAAVADPPCHALTASCPR
jgi:hypothetical protein